MCQTVVCSVALLSAVTVVDYFFDSAFNCFETLPTTGYI